MFLEKKIRKIISSSIILFALSFCIFFLPEISYAQATNEVFNNAGRLACEITYILTGKVALSVATFAIVLLGFKAFKGQLDMDIIMIVCISILALVGFAQITKSIIAAGGISGGSTFNESCVRVY